METRFCNRRITALNGKVPVLRDQEHPGEIPFHGSSVLLLRLRGSRYIVIDLDSIIARSRCVVSFYCVQGGSTAFILNIVDKNVRSQIFDFLFDVYLV